MAEALPSPSLTIREAPRKNPSDSLAFRELLPQSADSGRHLDEVGEAVCATASAIRGVDRSGDSFLAPVWVADSVAAQFLLGAAKPLARIIGQRARFRL